MKKVKQLLLLLLLAVSSHSAVIENPGTVEKVDTIVKANMLMCIFEKEINIHTNEVTRLYSEVDKNNSKYFSVTDDGRVIDNLKYLKKDVETGLLVYTSKELIFLLGPKRISEDNKLARYKGQISSKRKNENTMLVMTCSTFVIKRSK